MKLIVLYCQHIFHKNKVKCIKKSKKWRAGVWRWYYLLLKLNKLSLKSRSDCTWIYLAVFIKMLNYGFRLSVNLKICKMCHKMTIRNKCICRPDFRRSGSTRIIIVDCNDLKLRWKWRFHELVKIIEMGRAKAKYHEI